MNENILDLEEYVADTLLKIDALIVSNKVDNNKVLRIMHEKSMKKGEEK